MLWPYQLWRHNNIPPVVAPASITAPVATIPGDGPLSLTQELAALDAARASLAGGEARRALRLLDTYDQSYPHGRLELEADVLRIDAMARSGRRDAARALAEAFLRKHPNSVLASRVRAHAQPTE